MAAMRMPTHPAGPRKRAPIAAFAIGAWVRLRFGQGRLTGNPLLRTPLTITNR